MGRALALGRLRRNRELNRLDGELDGLVSERERVPTVEPPEAPGSMRGTVTKHMVRQRLLEGVNRREENASRERCEVLREIEAIESGG